MFEQVLLRRTRSTPPSWPTWRKPSGRSGPLASSRPSPPTRPRTATRTWCPRWSACSQSETRTSPCWSVSSLGFSSQTRLSAGPRFQSLFVFFRVREVRSLPSQEAVPGHAGRSDWSAQLGRRGSGSEQGARRRWRPKCCFCLFVLSFNWTICVRFITCRFASGFCRLKS